MQWRYSVYGMDSSKLALGTPAFYRASPGQLVRVFINTVDLATNVARITADDGTTLSLPKSALYLNPYFSFDSPVGSTVAQMVSYSIPDQERRVVQFALSSGKGGTANNRNAQAFKIPYRDTYLTPTKLNRRIFAALQAASHSSPSNQGVENTPYLAHPMFANLLSTFSTERETLRIRLQKTSRHFYESDTTHLLTELRGLFLATINAYGNRFLSSDNLSKSMFYDFLLPSNISCVDYVVNSVSSKDFETIAISDPVVSTRWSRVFSYSEERLLPDEAILRYVVDTATEREMYQPLKNPFLDLLDGFTLTSSTSFLPYHCVFPRRPKALSPRFRAAHSVLQGCLRLNQSFAGILARIQCALDDVLPSVTFHPSTYKTLTAATISFQFSASLGKLEALFGVTLNTEKGAKLLSRLDALPDKKAPFIVGHEGSLTALSPSTDLFSAILSFWLSEIFPFFGPYAVASLQDSHSSLMDGLSKQVNYTSVYFLTMRFVASYVARFLEDLIDKWVLLLHKSTRMLLHWEGHQASSDDGKTESLAARLSSLGFLPYSSVDCVSRIPLQTFSFSLQQIHTAGTVNNIAGPVVIVPSPSPYEAAMDLTRLLLTFTAGPLYIPIDPTVQMAEFYRLRGIGNSTLTNLALHQNTIVAILEETSGQIPILLENIAAMDEFHCTAEKFASLVVTFSDTLLDGFGGASLASRATESVLRQHINIGTTGPVAFGLPEGDVCNTYLIVNCSTQEPDSDGQKICGFDTLSTSSSPLSADKTSSSATCQYTPMNPIAEAGHSTAALQPSASLASAKFGLTPVQASDPHDPDISAALAILQALKDALACKGARLTNIYATSIPEDDRPIISKASPDFLVKLVANAVKIIQRIDRNVVVIMTLPPLFANSFVVLSTQGIKDEFLRYLRDLRAQIMQHIAHNMDMLLHFSLTTMRLTEDLIGTGTNDPRRLTQVISAVKDAKFLIRVWAPVASYLVDLTPSFASLTNRYLFLAYPSSHHDRDTSARKVSLALPDISIHSTARPTSVLHAPSSSDSSEQLPVHAQGASDDDSVGKLSPIMAFLDSLCRVSRLQRDAHNRYSTKIRLLSRYLLQFTDWLSATSKLLRSMTLEVAKLQLMDLFNARYNPHKFVDAFPLLATNVHVDYLDDFLSGPSGDRAINTADAATFIRALQESSEILVSRDFEAQLRREKLGALSESEAQRAVISRWRNLYIRPEKNSLLPNTNNFPTDADISDPSIFLADNDAPDGSVQAQGDADYAVFLPSATNTDKPFSRTQTYDVLRIFQEIYTILQETNRLYETAILWSQSLSVDLHISEAPSDIGATIGPPCILIIATYKLQRLFSHTLRKSVAEVSSETTLFVRLLEDCVRAVQDIRSSNTFGNWISIASTAEQLVQLVGPQIMVLFFLSSEHLADPEIALFNEKMGVRLLADRKAQCQDILRSGSLAAVYTASYAAHRHGVQNAECLTKLSELDDWLSRQTLSPTLIEVDMDLKPLQKDLLDSLLKELEHATKSAAKHTLATSHEHALQDNAIPSIVTASLALKDHDLGSFVALPERASTEMTEDAESSFSQNTFPGSTPTSVLTSRRASARAVAAQADAHVAKVLQEARFLCRALDQTTLKNEHAHLLSLVEIIGGFVGESRASCVFSSYPYVNVNTKLSGALREALFSLATILSQHCNACTQRQARIVEENALAMLSLLTGLTRLQTLVPVALHIYNGVYGATASKASSSIFIALQSLDMTKIVTDTLVFCKELYVEINRCGCSFLGVIQSKINVVARISSLCVKLSSALRAARCAMRKPVCLLYNNRILPEALFAPYIPSLWFGRTSERSIPLLNERDIIGTWMFSDCPLFLKTVAPSTVVLKSQCSRLVTGLQSGVETLEYRKAGRLPQNLLMASFCATDSRLQSDALAYDCKRALALAVTGQFIRMFLECLYQSCLCAISALVFLHVDGDVTRILTLYFTIFPNMLDCLAEALKHFEATDAAQLAGRHYPLASLIEDRIIFIHALQSRIYEHKMLVTQVLRDAVQYYLVSVKRVTGQQDIDCAIDSHLQSHDAVRDILVYLANDPTAGSECVTKGIYPALATNNILSTVIFSLPFDAALEDLKDVITSSPSTYSPSTQRSEAHRKSRKLVNLPVLDETNDAAYQSSHSFGILCNEVISNSIGHYIGMPCIFDTVPLNYKQLRVLTAMGMAAAQRTPSVLLADWMLGYAAQDFYLYATAFSRYIGSRPRFFYVGSRDDPAVLCTAISASLLSGCGVYICGAEFLPAEHLHILVNFLTGIYVRDGNFGSLQLADGAPVRQDFCRHNSASLCELGYVVFCLPQALLSENGSARMTPCGTKFLKYLSRYIEVLLPAYDGVVLYSYYAKLHRSTVQKFGSLPHGPGSLEVSAPHGYLYLYDQPSMYAHFGNSVLLSHNERRLSFLRKSTLFGAALYGISSFLATMGLSTPHLLPEDVDRIMLTTSDQKSALSVACTAAQHLCVRTLIPEVRAAILRIVSGYFNLEDANKTLLQLSVYTLDILQHMVLSEKGDGGEVDYDEEANRCLKKAKIHGFSELRAASLAQRIWLLQRQRYNANYTQLCESISSQSVFLEPPGADAMLTLIDFLSMGPTVLLSSSRMHSRMRFLSFFVDICCTISKLRPVWVTCLSDIHTHIGRIREYGSQCIIVCKISDVQDPLTESLLPAIMSLSSGAPSVFFPEFNFGISLPTSSRPRILILSNSWNTPATATSSLGTLYRTLTVSSSYMRPLAYVNASILQPLGFVGEPSDSRFLSFKARFECGTLESAATLSEVHTYFATKCLARPKTLPKAKVEQDTRVRAASKVWHVVLQEYAIEFSRLFGLQDIMDMHIWIVLRTVFLLNLNRLGVLHMFPSDSNLADRRILDTLAGASSSKDSAARSSCLPNELSFATITGLTPLGSYESSLKLLTHPRLNFFSYDFTDDYIDEFICNAPNNTFLLLHILLPIFISFYNAFYVLYLHMFKRDSRAFARRHQRIIALLLRDPDGLLSSLGSIFRVSVGTSREPSQISSMRQNNAHDADTQSDLFRQQVTRSSDDTIRRESEPGEQKRPHNAIDDALRQILALFPQAHSTEQDAIRSPFTYLYLSLAEDAAGSLLSTVSMTPADGPFVYSRDHAKLLHKWLSAGHKSSALDANAQLPPPSFVKAAFVPYSLTEGLFKSTEIIAMSKLSTPLRLALTIDDERAMFVVYFASLVLSRTHLCLVGPPCSGKSTYVELVTLFLTDYAKRVCLTYTDTEHFSTSLSRLGQTLYLRFMAPVPVLDIVGNRMHITHIVAVESSVSSDDQRVLSLQQVSSSGATPLELGNQVANLASQSPDVARPGLSVLVQGFANGFLNTIATSHGDSLRISDILHEGVSGGVFAFGTTIVLEQTSLPQQLLDSEMYLLQVPTCKARGYIVTLLQRSFPPPSAIATPETLYEFSTKYITQYADGLLLVAKVARVSVFKILTSMKQSMICSQDVANNPGDTPLRCLTLGLLFATLRQMRAITSPILAQILDELASAVAIGKLSPYSAYGILDPANIPAFLRKNTFFAQCNLKGFVLRPSWEQNIIDFSFQNSEVQRGTDAFNEKFSDTHGYSGNATDDTHSRAGGQAARGNAFSNMSHQELLTKFKTTMLYDYNRRCINDDIFPLFVTFYRKHLCHYVDPGLASFFFTIFLRMTVESELNAEHVFHLLHMLRDRSVFAAKKGAGALCYYDNLSLRVPSFVATACEIHLELSSLLLDVLSKLGGFIIVDTAFVTNRESTADKVADEAKESLRSSSQSLFKNEDVSDGVLEEKILLDSDETSSASFSTGTLEPEAAPSPAKSPAPPQSRSTLDHILGLFACTNDEYIDGNIRRFHRILVDVQILINALRSPAVSRILTLDDPKIVGSKYRRIIRLFFVSILRLLGTPAEPDIPTLILRAAFCMSLGITPVFGSYTLEQRGSVGFFEGTDSVETTAGLDLDYVCSVFGVSSITDLFATVPHDVLLMVRQSQLDNILSRRAVSGVSSLCQPGISVLSMFNAYEIRVLGYMLSKLLGLSVALSAHDIANIASRSFSVLVISDVSVHSSMKLPYLPHISHLVSQERRLIDSMHNTNSFMLSLAFSASHTALLDRKLVSRVPGFILRGTNYGLHVGFFTSRYKTSSISALDRDPIGTAARNANSEEGLLGAPYLDIMTPFDSELHPFVDMFIESFARAVSIVYDVCTSNLTPLCINYSLHRFTELTAMVAESTLRRNINFMASVQKFVVVVKLLNSGLLSGLFAADAQPKIAAFRDRLAATKEILRSDFQRATQMVKNASCDAALIVARLLFFPFIKDEYAGDSQFEKMLCEGLRRQKLTNLSVQIENTKIGDAILRAIYNQNGVVSDEDHVYQFLNSTGANSKILSLAADFLRPSFSADICKGLVKFSGIQMQTILSQLLAIRLGFLLFFIQGDSYEYVVPAAELYNLTTSAGHAKDQEEKKYSQDLLHTLRVTEKSSDTDADYNIDALKASVIAYIDCLLPPQVFGSMLADALAAQKSVVFLHMGNMAAPLPNIKAMFAIISIVCEKTSKKKTALTISEFTTVPVMPMVLHKYRLYFIMDPDTPFEFLSRIGYINDSTSSHTFLLRPRFENTRRAAHVFDVFSPNVSPVRMAKHLLNIERGFAIDYLSRVVNYSSLEVVQRNRYFREMEDLHTKVMELSAPLYKHIIANESVSLRLVKESEGGGAFVHIPEVCGGASSTRSSDSQSGINYEALGALCMQIQRYVSHRREVYESIMRVREANTYADIYGRSMGSLYMLILRLASIHPSVAVALSDRVLRHLSALIDSKQAAMPTPTFATIMLSCQHLLLAVLEQSPRYFRRVVAALFAIVYTIGFQLGRLEDLNLLRVMCMHDFRGLLAHLDPGFNAHLPRFMGARSLIEQYPRSFAANPNLVINWKHLCIFSAYAPDYFTEWIEFFMQNKSVFTMLSFCDNAYKMILGSYLYKERLLADYNTKTNELQALSGESPPSGPQSFKAEAVRMLSKQSATRMYFPVLPSKLPDLIVTYSASPIPLPRNIQLPTLENTWRSLLLSLALRQNLIQNAFETYSNIAQPTAVGDALQQADETHETLRVAFARNTGNHTALMSDIPTRLCAASFLAVGRSIALDTIGLGQQAGQQRSDAAGVQLNQPLICGTSGHGSRIVLAFYDCSLDPLYILHDLIVSELRLSLNLSDIVFTTFPTPEDLKHKVVIVRATSDQTSILETLATHLEHYQRPTHLLYILVPVSHSVRYGQEIFEQLNNPSTNVARAICRFVDSADPVIVYLERPRSLYENSRHFMTLFGQLARLTNTDLWSLRREHIKVILLLVTFCSHIAANQHFALPDSRVITSLHHVLCWAHCSYTVSKIHSSFSKALESLCDLTEKNLATSYTPNVPQSNATITSQSIGFSALHFLMKRFISLPAQRSYENRLLESAPFILNGDNSVFFSNVAVSYLDNCVIDQQTMVAGTDNIASLDTDDSLGDLSDDTASTTGSEVSTASLSQLSSRSIRSSALSAANTSSVRTSASAAIASASIGLEDQLIAKEFEPLVRQRVALLWSTRRKLVHLTATNRTRTTLSIPTNVTTESFTAMIGQLGNLTHKLEEFTVANTNTTAILGDSEKSDLLGDVLQSFSIVPPHTFKRARISREFVTFMLSSDVSCFLGGDVLKMNSYDESYIASAEVSCPTIVQTALGLSIFYGKMRRLAGPYLRTPLEESQSPIRMLSSTKWIIRGDLYEELLPEMTRWFHLQHCLKSGASMGSTAVIFALHDIAYYKNETFSINGAGEVVVTPVNRKDKLFRKHTFPMSMKVSQMRLFNISYDFVLQTIVDMSPETPDFPLYVDIFAFVVDRLSEGGDASSTIRESDIPTPLSDKQVTQTYSPTYVSVPLSFSDTARLVLRNTTILTADDLRAKGAFCGTGYFM